MLSVLQIKLTYCLDGYFELSRPDKVRSYSSVFGLHCVVDILVAFCSGADPGYVKRGDRDPKGGRVADITPK